MTVIDNVNGSKIKHRLGKFYVPLEIMVRRDIHKILFYMGFTPYRVKELIDGNSYEYIGTSPMFDLVDKGGSIIEYKIEYELKECGALDVCVEKVI